jgi:4-hydroxybenzoate polyprenyltransferase
VPRAPRTTLGGLIRLVHPFPVVLDGIACAAVVGLAGGGTALALRLGLSMLALQASIGALNDLVDAPIDAGRKPGKPIPAGTISPVAARLVVGGTAAAGVLLTLPSGLGLAGLALVGLSIGYAYNLAAKGSAWSWLPFALGLPLLPVFAWYGATGTLPAPFVFLVPAAVVAGAALAIANALADEGRDESAGIASVAIALGPRRAWAIGAGFQAAVGIAAAVSLRLSDASATPLMAALASAAIVLLGVGLSRGWSPARRERGWEIQAIGVALLGASWLWGIAGRA